VLQLNSKKMQHQVRNPRNGQYDYQFDIPTTKTLKKTCKILRGGQKTWQTNGIAYRIEAMQAWKIQIEKQKENIIEALTHDTGRKAESVLEANLLLSSIDRWCGIAQDFFKENSRKTSAIPFIEIQQAVVPYSLVGVISPWNFPLLLSIIDAIPALLAGCAVIVKPSEVTPRFIAPLMQSINDTPQLVAVFSYVAGAGKTGADMMQNVDLVCFTGSVATGKKVYTAAAKQFIPVFLELGGKDAALVLEGADLALASASLLWGSSVNAGHSCLSIERIYVQETIFDDFLQLLIKRTEALKFAYPSVSDGQIGPIISDKQVKIIDVQLKDALQKGAILHTGKGFCENIGGGHWCFPTILTNVNHTMKVMTEETFGPIMPIMSFKTVEQGIELANDSIFGLSGAVFAQTPEHGLAIAKHLQAGAISINDSALTAIIHEGEKNSFKASGIGGTRMGAAAIKRFMRQKAYLIKKQAVPSPWWF
jgi:succinate-semialdehyde dehydrogenase / glutarate-semialdehyde dehydrogenase